MDEFIKHLVDEDGANVSQFRSPELGPLPSTENLQHARNILAQTSRKLPENGLGLNEVSKILIESILPALPNHSAQYYGFVTGGVTPAARLADHLATWTDASLQVHLPKESIGTELEDASLQLLLDLLKLDRTQWLGRTITTGATASNVLALACAREYVISGTDNNFSVGEYGLANAMKKSGIKDIQVLACKSHSSLGKAAAIVGLGRQSVVQISHENKPWDFDLVKLEQQLSTNSQNNIASIVCANFGEVNTGQYTSDIKQIRALCDKYKNTWLHIDGAFGAYLRALRDKPDSPYFNDALRVTEGLELADSITGDSHKTLNVPYDSGVFLTRHHHVMSAVFQNPGAVYLSSDDSSIPSPLNIGIENSRRFRALAVYATLLSYGDKGYCEFIERLIRFSRRLSAWVHESSDYELHLDSPADVFTVILLRAKDQELNKTLKERINQINRAYVSGTVWNGAPAIRIAPCNWNIRDGDEDIVIKVLEEVVSSFRLNQ